MYKIKSKDIDKSIRFKGNLIRLLFPSFNKKRFKLANKLINKFLKGKYKGKNTISKEIYLNNNNEEIRILIIKRKDFINTNNSKILYWIHGGGFAIGAPEQDSYYMDYILDNNTIGIMIDYTLSTISFYPKALHEIYFVYNYLKLNYKNLNIDKDKIYLGGTSAGASLAISLILYLLDKKEEVPKKLLALYPMLSYFDTNSNKNNDAPVWNTKSNKIAWELYKNKNLKIDKYFSPSLSTSFKGFSETTLIIGDIDPFLDENLDFINKLNKDNIKTNYKIYKGCYHAFDYIARNSNIGKDAKKFILDNFKLD